MSINLANQGRLQVRLVIPQSLIRGGEPVYELAVRFFARQGETVYTQEKLLKLSKSLPAIVEGEVNKAAFESFLMNFADIDKIVILTGNAAAQKALAA